MVYFCGSTTHAFDIYDKTKIKDFAYGLYRPKRNIPRNSGLKCTAPVSFRA